MSRPDVTILIPSYRTAELTKLCLRLINKYTPRDEIEVIVIDNDSGDESLEYLRSLGWIRLIERARVEGERPAEAHSRALDLALERVESPYVLAMHTDTLVHDARWLSYLRDQLTSRPEVAGVGSWKLETKSALRRIAKRAESWMQQAVASLKGTDRAQPGDSAARYLRSHCALYRCDLIRRYDLRFTSTEGSAGEALHRELEARGHDLLFLPPETLLRYMLHLNHATMVLNPQLGARTRTIRTGRRRMDRMLAEIGADGVLADDRLDR